MVANEILCRPTGGLRKAGKRACERPLRDAYWASRWCSRWSQTRFCADQREDCAKLGKGRVNAHFVTRTGLRGGAPDGRMRDSVPTNGRTAQSSEKGV